MADYITELQTSATERVNASDVLRPFSWLLLLDWSAQVGFAKFNAEAYYLHLNTASEIDLLNWCTDIIKPLACFNDLASNVDLSRTS